MNRSAGFTLIELLISVAIVGLLAMVAYPAYTEQLQKGRRGETQGGMMGLAAALESHKARRFSYDGATLGDLAPDLDASDHYDVTLTIPADGRSYTVLAKPIGPQAGDGALKIDSQNRTCHDPSSDADCDLTDASLAWNQ